MSAPLRSYEISYPKLFINMATQTVFATAFGCSNYLMNPKPGEKRTFFKSTQTQPDTIPYVIDFLTELSGKVETNNRSVARYGHKMPFQVPQIKMPLVSGFVGAKSQSLRGNPVKLCDILPDLFAKSFNCDVLLSNEEKSKESMAIQSTETQKEKAVLCKREINPTTMTKESIGVAIIEGPVVPDKCKSMVENSMKKNCRDKMNGEDKEKPPRKKPKLQTSPLPSRRKRTKKRSNFKRKVQCDPEPMSPGYDPSQSSFENINEVDCCIELSNRFAPLEDVSNFQMWSESPTDPEPSDPSLLDMLSDMHLDDFEVQFDNASPTIEVYDVRPYEQDSPLTCNSSIAFIIGGNDDILTSDSEDDSFSSDFEDLQWQSFKADFEVFREQIPLQDLVMGACNLSRLNFQEDFEVLDSDYFLNNLECQTANETEQRLREVNLRWDKMCGDDATRPTSPKVCFAPDESLTSVRYIPSGPEECQARRSSWDQCYMDKCRFQKKIKELEPIISLCLTPQHRKSVFQRLYSQDQ